MHAVTVTFDACITTVGPLSVALRIAAGVLAATSAALALLWVAARFARPIRRRP